jgi:hypothetical protein
MFGTQTRGTAMSFFDVFFGPLLPAIQIVYRLLMWLLALIGGPIV